METLKVTVVAKCVHERRHISLRVPKPHFMPITKGPAGMSYDLIEERPESPGYWWAKDCTTGEKVLIAAECESAFELQSVPLKKLFELLKC